MLDLLVDGLAGGVGGHEPRQELLQGEAEEPARDHDEEDDGERHR